MFDPAEIRTSSFAAVPAAERLEALNAQLSYAVARSPYYLAALGQDALRLSSLSELPRLPFLSCGENLPLRGLMPACQDKRVTRRFRAAQKLILLSRC